MCLGFGFWWHIWVVLGLNTGRGNFLNFFVCGSNDFLMQKVYLLRLMWVYVGLRMLALILIGPQSLGHFCLSYRPLLPIGQRKVTNTAPTTLSAGQATNHAIHFYQCTIILHLWLAGMGQNKQQTLLNQRYLVNRNKYTFCTIKTSEPRNNLKTSCVPYFNL